MFALPLPGTHAASIVVLSALLTGAGPMPARAGQEPQAQPRTQEPQPQVPKAQEPVPAAPQEPERIPVDTEAEQQGHPVRELSLDEALRIGRTSNVELRSAELLPKQAVQDLLVAEAVFNPELYGDVGLTRSKSPQRNAFQPSISRDTIDATLGWRQRVMTGGLFDLAYRPARISTSSASGAFPDRQFTSEFAATYTQPLLRSAWSDYNLAGIDLARHGLARAAHDFDTTVQDTLLAVVQAYWELAFARENYLVVTAAGAVAREQLRITEERIRVEQLAPRDRVADEAEVARREEERIVALNEIRRREDALRRLIFADEGGDLWRWNLRPTEPIAVEPEVKGQAFEPLVDVAMANRPDLKSLRSLVAEAEIDLLQANRDLLPALDLVGTYSSDGVRDHFDDAFGDSLDLEFPDWGVRLQFSIPIGNQAARARRLRVELEVERRRRVLYGTMMTVTQEVREAVRNLGSLAESIRAGTESVRLARTNLETERVKLGVGLSTPFEVQRRNQEVREARSRLLRNQLDYRVAESRLLHAQGLLAVPVPR